MSVTTKRGDAGWTDLLFSGRARKDGLRIHAVGTLDELNSLLGLAKASIRNRKTRQVIHAIQREIFIVSSELITLPRNLRRLELRVDDACVKRLEALTAALERRVKLTECCFLIPGESASSALLDVCRTATCRFTSTGSPTCSICWRGLRKKVTRRLSRENGIAAVPRKYERKRHNLVGRQ